MSLSIHSSRTPGKRLARALGQCLKRNIKRPVLLLVSGGSALSVLDLVERQALSKNLTVSVLDERFSRDPNVSNYLQLMRTSFYTRAKARGATFLSPVPFVGESLVGTAARFRRAIRAWQLAHSESVVIASMGIGLNGHTAGIMPLSDDPARFKRMFEREGRQVVGYDAGAGNKYTRRITVTISFLRTEVHHVFAYAVGKEKKKIIKMVLSSRNAAAYPASILNRMRNAKLYTDAYA